MEKAARESLIVCDECSSEFEPQSIEFKKSVTNIGDKKFEVVYYKCPSCGKIYTVCMLDYMGRKLQEKYVTAVKEYRLAIDKRTNSVKLQQKAAKIEKRKVDAMHYQQKILKQYGNLLPMEIFV